MRLDFATSIMKPLTLKWLLESWQHVKGLTAGCIRCYEKVGTLRALSALYQIDSAVHMQRLFGCSVSEDIQAMVPIISEGFEHCTTEQFVAEVDDDIALCPHEIIEGLNAALLSKAVVDELDVVDDEQAWERPVVNDPDPHGTSFDQLSSMSMIQLAEYATSMRDALDNWSQGDGEGQITRRRRKKKATPQPKPLGQAPQPLIQNQAQTQPQEQPPRPLSQNQAQTQPQVHPPEPLVQNEALGNPQPKKCGQPTKAVEQEDQPHTKEGRGRPPGSTNKPKAASEVHCN